MRSFEIHLLTSRSVLYLLVLLSIPLISSANSDDQFFDQLQTFLTSPGPRALAVARVDGEAIAWGIIVEAVDLQTAKRAAIAICRAKTGAQAINVPCVVEAISDEPPDPVIGNDKQTNLEQEVLSLRAISKFQTLFEEQVKLFLECKGAKALAIAQEEDQVVAWGLRTNEKNPETAKNAALESCQRNVNSRGLKSSCRIVSWRDRLGTPTGNSVSNHGVTTVVKNTVEKPRTSSDHKAVASGFQIDSVIGVLEMPVFWSPRTVTIPGHEDIEIRGVRISLSHQRATVILYFYQHKSHDKEVLYTVDIVSVDGEYLGGSTQYICLDEGEKNTKSISFALNQKYLHTDANRLIARVKIHSVQLH